MSLIIDETNKAALKEALGITKLEADVKALQNAASASASEPASSDPDPDTLDPNS
jgi:hypothetical protein